MLYYETIDAKTLELLKSLLQIPDFKDLRLVGGTSLALQIGHRKSIDIDLFGSINLNGLIISNHLQIFEKYSVINQTKHIYSFLINGIKVDFVNYPYSWIEECYNIDNLRLAGKGDIAAMKLAAITGRGSKKDFIDIYFLCKEYDFKKLIEFYNTKFPDGSIFLVLKSLTYFDDAEDEPNPFMIQHVDWEVIKKFIILMVEDYLKDEYNF